MLWDVDFTLIDADGAGRRLYQTALRDMYGLPLPRAGQSFGGRTDSAIALEILALAGVPDPKGQLQRFQDYMSQLAGDLEEDVRRNGRVLPGAPDILAALALGTHGQPVIQSLLTGNLPALARVKLSALQLTEHLDLHDRRLRRHQRGPRRPRPGRPGEGRRQARRRLRRPVHGAGGRHPE